MRLAFWRAGPGKPPVKDRFVATSSAPSAAVQDDAAPNTTTRKSLFSSFRKPGARGAPVAFGRKPASVAGAPVLQPRVATPVKPLSASGDLDLRVIWQTLLRKKHWVIGPTLIALVTSMAIVNAITPRYKSEARILIDGRENVFLRPNGERAEERSALDPEAVTSQVQLLLSRDLAREIIRKNKLAELPEFDPVLKGVSPLKSLMALVGIGRDPFTMTPEERVLDSYFERFTAYAVDKSRVMVIEFQSRDPDLAAKIANSIADGYLTMQQGARQDQAKSAGTWLSGEIDVLRKKVADAESKVEEFRSGSSLFIGTNNTSLSNQQMGEINTQLSNARAQKSDAESRARLIREMLNTGKPIEATEVANSELMRRLSEQRVTLRAQLAEQSSTLLDQHPRIKELKAQLTDLDRQLREEASKISRSLENDAKIASAKLEGLTGSLDQLKKQATSTNGQDVQLRALEREAKAQRDLLESYLAKYREATARENIDAAPTDGRIISRAIVSNTPAYPKKMPIVLIATLATLILTAGGIATSELLRITAPGLLAAPSTSVAIEPRFVSAPATPPVATSDREPMLTAAVPVVAPPDIAALADTLLGAGASSRKVTVLGSGAIDSISLTALSLARAMATKARVVLIDLSTSATVLASATTDQSAPGLAELMHGEASFGQIITRDRASPLHLVSSGRPGADRALLQSPRLGMALDALMQAYDHVLLDAGTALDLPASLLTAQARAVVVPDGSMDAEARKLLADQLKAVGFGEVAMLSQPVAADPIMLAPRVAAA